jgi:hypothetical protein
MRRSFTLNTQPHEAEIAGTVLYFVPEAEGDAFVDAYARLQEAQKGAGDEGGPEQLKKVTAALREFLTDLMLPESREVFAEMRLPARVLVEVTQWLAETYGGGAGGAEGQGGSGGRPTGRSSGSAPSRRTPGTPSKAN